MITVERGSFEGEPGMEPIKFLLAATPKGTERTFYLTKPLGSDERQFTEEMVEALGAELYRQNRNPDYPVTGWHIFVQRESGELWDRYIFGPDEDFKKAYPELLGDVTDWGRPLASNGQESLLYFQATLTDQIMREGTNSHQAYLDYLEVHALGIAEKERLSR